MPARPPSAAVAAAVGLAGLAAAMGIGRFAFTPLLPLMQADGLSLAQGGWLAGANYLGYFAGAMASMAAAPRPSASARWGLVAVALSTLAMGLTSQIAAWIVLRFAAGAASAFVLVGAAGWAMAQLGARGQAGRTGWVFAGVGLGIAIAGLAVLAGGAFGADAASDWLALGALATAVAAATWRVFGAPVVATAAAPAAAPRAGGNAALLVLAYGLFGLGYIVPATFIPAAARSLAADPAVFGWAWPLFGAAAFASTITVAVALPQAPPRRLAAAALWVMAAGVLAPALWMNFGALLFSALAVGGTFMVVTMACMQEARRIGGASATRLMSGMTAAFAAGQAIGPLAVRAGPSAAQAIVVPSLAATVLLVIAALALQRRPAAAAKERTKLHA